MRAVKRSGGGAFSYSGDLVPDQSVLSELAASGWTYHLVTDDRDGDYYQISPSS